jgi:hypothetical protein
MGGNGEKPGTWNQELPFDKLRAGQPQAGAGPFLYFEFRIQNPESRRENT